MAILDQLADEQTPALVLSDVKCTHCGFNIIDYVEIAAGGLEVRCNECGHENRLQIERGLNWQTVNDVLCNKTRRGSGGDRPCRRKLAESTVGFRGLVRIRCKRCSGRPDLTAADAVRKCDRGPNTSGYLSPREHGND